MQLNKEQIKAWQKFVGVKIDGDFGAATEKATKAFQTENNLRVDGRFGENTLSVAKTLGFKLPVVLSGTAVETVLPEAGTGFVGYNREKNGADQYGTAFTIAAIIEIGKAWHKSHPDVPLQIGDISRKGGGYFSPHSAHRTGRDFDARPIRKDGKRLPCDYRDAAYDAARTEDLVRLVRKLYPGAIIYFNDPKLIVRKLTAQCPGHANHLHFRLK